MTENIIEITVEEMDSLIERMESNLEDGLSTEPEDVRLILLILRQFATMQQKLEGSSYLKQRYLKLMGLVSASEDKKNLFNKGSKTKKDSPRKKKPKVEVTPPKVCHHALTELEKGQSCPECEKGRLYKTEPASFVRITGQAPLTAEKHIMEQLRCNLCGQMFTAQLPDDVLTDGARQQRYGFSARAIMAIDKFYMGSPYFRQESLQSLMSMPITASTIYDQCAHLADDIAPVFEYLKAQSANAVHFHIDDTGNKILGESAIEKPNRTGEGTRKRTGVYSSCLIATMGGGQRVVLFKTNIGHSGEWLDEILSQRTKGLPMAIVMSDALPSNTPTEEPCEKSLCNAHSRRKFVDIVTNFPEEVEFFVETYSVIWKNEKTTTVEQMTAQARLAYHKKHSYPVMRELQSWCAEKLKNCSKTEENSGLGKAMRYFLKHFEGLSAFCRLEGALLDNNLAEMVLKLIARGRKNALFYKTLAGAHVGDVITSIIASCELNGINCFEYLKALQENRRSMELAPEKWMPWNYQENIQEVAVT